jgi:pSer/pThr/pTyr-binding forkhead associated (FHA) protein
MVKLQLKFNAAVIKEHPFTKDELTVGRKPENDIVIDNPAVSGRHARIVKQGDEYLIEDLNSTNGTFLKDRKILKAVLHNKDEVFIAKHSIVFLNDQETASPAASASQSVSSDSTVVMSAPPKPVAPSTGGTSRPAAEAVGALRVVAGESNAPSFSMVGLTTYIGKSDQAQVRLKGFFAPDMAACIARKPEGYFLKVLKEKTVKVNGQVVVDQSPLNVGDKIEIAGLTLMFFQQDANAPMSG